MNKEIFNNSAFYLEHINDVLALCYVDIKAFCRQLLNCASFDNLKVKNIHFTQDNFKQVLLCQYELNRLNSFKILKKQVEWIAGRFSIKHLVKQFVSPDKDYSDIVIAYQDEGAPYIRDHADMSISISHSYDYAIGGLALKDGITFGIDIEKMCYIKEDNIPSFFNIAFSSKEQDYLSDKKIDVVYKNWTIKEAFLKYIKRGFHEPIHNIEIFDDGLYFKGERMDHLTCITKLFSDDYVFSILHD